MVNVLWMIVVCCLCEKCLFDSQTVNERDCVLAECNDEEKWKEKAKV